MKFKQPNIKKVQSKDESLNDSQFINNWLNVSVATNGNNDSSMIFNPSAANNTKVSVDDSTIKFFKGPDESYME